VVGDPGATIGIAKKRLKTKVTEFSCFLHINEVYFFPTGDTITGEHQKSKYPASFEVFLFAVFIYIFLQYFVSSADAL
jgi:hypothetical protein